MPPGHVTFAADADNSGLLRAVTSRFGEHNSGGADVRDTAPEHRHEERVDVLLTCGPPERPATHIVVTGELTEALDDWDLHLPAQTVAGVLWAPAGPDAADAVIAWLALRRQTPTTPLSDLTDANDRALRWSLVAAHSLPVPTHAGTAEVDDAEVRAWLDDQPQVQELGAAVDRIGGDTAEAALQSVDRFRAALHGLAELGDLPPAPENRDLDNALADHLRQVQRSGFGRWRSGRARSESQATLAAAAKDLAATGVLALIDDRRGNLLVERQAQGAEQAADELADRVRQCLNTLELPATVDHSKVPRSWPGEPAQPRRYLLLHPADADAMPAIEDTPVRFCEDLPRGHALCVLVQSGFSLPGLR